jgi:hypothetical protein
MPALSQMVLARIGWRLSGRSRDQALLQIWLVPAFPA